LKIANIDLQTIITLAAYALYNFDTYRLTFKILGLALV